MMSIHGAEGRYKANVIFDFDLTIFPEESTLGLVQRAVAENERLRNFIFNYATRKKTFISKIAGIVDYMSVVSKINRENLSECINLARPKIDPVFPGLMQDLRDAGIKPFVISSGYSELISPLLNDLGFQDGDIAANRFLWVGAKALTVMPSPLHGSNGKVKVVQQWKASGRLMGPLIMVGDSLPDRKVYLHGLADGFIQADYYTKPIDTGLSGNVEVASSPDMLRDQLFKLLERVRWQENSRSIA